MPRGKNITTKEKKQMQDLYNQGVEVVDIAKKFNCSKRTVYTYITLNKKGKGKVKSKNTTVTQKDFDLIKTLLKNKISKSKITKISERGCGTVYEIEKAKTLDEYRENMRKKYEKKKEEEKEAQKLKTKTSDQSKVEVVFGKEEKQAVNDLLKVSNQIRGLLIELNNNITKIKKTTSPSKKWWEKI